MGIYNDSLASVLHSRSSRNASGRDSRNNNLFIDHTYPIMSLEERVLSILGCKYVSDVLVDAPYVLSSNIVSSLNITCVAIESTCQLCRKVASSSSGDRGSESESVGGSGSGSGSGSESGSNRVLMCIQCNALIGGEGESGEEYTHLTKDAMQSLREKGNVKVLHSNFSITGKKSIKNIRINIKMTSKIASLIE